MGRGHGMWPAVGCVVGLTVLLALVAVALIVGQVLSFVFGTVGFLTRPFAGLAFVVLVLAVIGLMRGFDAWQRRSGLWSTRPDGSNRAITRHGYPKSIEVPASSAN